MAETRSGLPYETRDIGAGPAALILVVLGAAVAAPLVLVTLLYGWFWQAAEPRPDLLTVPPPGDVTPAPTLQTAPGHDLAVFRRKVNERLSGIGWTDREGGIAHIPIEDAMRLYLERSR